MKIALVGQPAVGKDAVAEYLTRQYAMSHISSSDLIRAYVTENNLGGLDRANLQKVANELRTERGGDYLVRLAVEKHPDNLILTGLRAIGEVETFKRLGGTIIAIIAPIEFRYELAKKRGRIGDGMTFEEFKRIEDQEAQSVDPNAQNVTKVLQMATITIVNDGSLEQLFEKVSEVVRRL